MMMRVFRMVWLMLAVLGGACDRPKDLSKESDDELLTKIEENMAPLRTARSGYRVLDLDSVATFWWDSVYFFKDDSGDDTSRSISQTLGFTWQGRPIPENYERILFVKNRTVVRIVDCNQYPPPGTAPHPTWINVCLPGRQHGFARSQARFLVVRRCSDEGVGYCLYSAECLKYKALRRSIAHGIARGYPDSLENLVQQHAESLRAD